MKPNEIWNLQRKKGFYLKMVSIGFIIIIEEVYSTKGNFTNESENSSSGPSNGVRVAFLIIGLIFSIFLILWVIFVCRKLLTIPGNSARVGDSRLLNSNSQNNNLNVTSFTCLISY